MGEPWGEEAAGQARCAAEPPASSTTPGGDAFLSLATLPAGKVMADALQLLVPILSGFEANKGEKILFFSLFLAFGISCAGQTSNASESPSLCTKQRLKICLCVRGSNLGHLFLAEKCTVVI